MKLMKSLFVAAAILAAGLMTTACSNKGNQQTQTEAEATPVVLTVDQVLAQGDSLVGQTISVEGVCTHLCKHGGKKLFMMGSTDKVSLRCEATPSVGRFSDDAINNEVVVTGVLVEDRIDEAYLLNWEEKIKADTDEKHGDNKEAGCDTEKKNRGESAEANTPEKRIADFRQRIAEREAAEGKAYLSFYHLDADSYDIKK
jgi:hypothetical protein